MRLPKIALFLYGGFILPVECYSQLPPLTIAGPEHFQYQVELKKLAVNGAVNFSFKGSLMSVQIENATLGSVLQELSRITGVDIYVSEYRAQESVSLAFENLPLKRALQRILGDNYTLGFNGLPGDEISISDLANIRLIHNVEAAAVAASKKMLQFTFNGLIEQSLINGDENERIFALKALKVNGGKIDDDLLRRLASDDSSKVRQFALKEVQEGFENKAAIAFLKTAANNDPDPDVRTYAKTAISSLENNSSAPFVANDKMPATTTIENTEDQTVQPKGTVNKTSTPSVPYVADEIEQATNATENTEDQTAELKGTENESSTPVVADEIEQATNATENTEDQTAELKVTENEPLTPVVANEIEQATNATENTEDQTAELKVAENKTSTPVVADEIEQATNATENTEDQTAELKVTENEPSTPAVADEVEQATTTTENTEDQTAVPKITENETDTHQSMEPNTQNSPLELAELALQNGDDQMRSDALESIRRSNLKVDLDLLLAATSDSNPLNRKLALDVIAKRLHPVEAKQILAQRIQTETDSGVKQHAEYTLDSVKKTAEWIYKIQL